MKLLVERRKDFAMKPNPTIPALVGLLSDLAVEEQEVLVSTEFRPTIRGAINQFLAGNAQTFFTLIPCEEVSGVFSDTLIKWCMLAVDLGYDGPVVYSVRQG